jgi:hypothetical protein
MADPLRIEIEIVPPLPDGLSRVTVECDPERLKHVRVGYRFPVEVVEIERRVIER